MMLSLAPSVAHAQSGNRAHLEQGLRLRRQGRNEQALREFEAAWSESHTPEARAQTGLAHAALQRWSDAEQILTEVLTGPCDAWVTGHRAQLEGARSLVRAHLARLRLDGPAATEVTVGDARVTLPQAEPLYVAPGELTLRATLRGHALDARTVALREGAEVTARFEAPVETAVTVRRTPVAPPRADTASRWSGQRTVAVVTGALALGALGFGVATSLVQQGHTDYLLSQGTVRDGFLDVPRGACPDCADRQDAQDLMHTLSIVGYATAGALSVATVVLWVTAPSRRDVHPATAMWCVPTRGDATITCGGAF